jgi:hypothetical protein
MEGLGWAGCARGLGLYLGYVYRETGPCKLLFCSGQKRGIMLWAVPTVQAGRCRWRWMDGGGGSGPQREN